MRSETLSSIEYVLGDQPGWVVIHSSLANLAPSKPFDKWDFVYVVKELSNRGWTVILPSFTFSFTSTKSFSLETNKSETGILADWVYETLPDAIRTDHPIYSFVLIGRGAAEILNCKNMTTFGDSSPFALFEKKNAQICLLGADWSDCTQFHRYEELADVPYRFFKNFEGVRSCNGKETPIKAKMFVRDHNLAAKNNFSPLAKKLAKENKIKSIQLERGKVQSCNVRDISAVASSQLSEDKLVYVEKKRITAMKIAQKSRREIQPEFRVAVAGSSNLDPYISEFEQRLNEAVPDRVLRYYSNPFGQLANEILAPKSNLIHFNANLTFFVDRLEDLLGVVNIEYLDDVKIVKVVENYCALIRKYMNVNEGKIFIHSLTANAASCSYGQKKITNILKELNDRISNYFLDHDKIFIVDISAIAQKSSTYFDPRTWYIGRFPYSNDMTKNIVKKWSSIALSQMEKTIRLIVLDLDNTLWGGVVGEDGIDGIKIGGDYPGNCFSDFQMMLKGLAKNGIALAICSKNDEGIAINVFENRSSMVLSKDDIVAHRINWQPKYQNIQELVKELSLGLESVLFIDDNPVERQTVRTNLPEVKVLDLPEDPALYSAALNECLWLETFTVSDLDRKRVASYKVKSKIETGIRTAESIEDFLTDLEIKVFIQSLSSNNVDRATQLCAKTNQFNTTSQRYSECDLYQLEADGHQVFVIGMEDTYTEKENIGLLVLKSISGQSGTIDLFLLSCRVLGRGIDIAVLEWCILKANTLGWTEVHGVILETDRNTPVRSIFSENGFRKTDSQNLWIRDDMLPKFPTFLTIKDETNET